MKVTFEAKLKNGQYVEITGSGSIDYNCICSGPKHKHADNVKILSVVSRSSSKPLAESEVDKMNDEISDLIAEELYKLD